MTTTKRGTESRPFWATETKNDLGPDILRFVYESMMVDEEWSVREPRGFTWWGHRLRQRVWADPPEESGGFSIVRLHAETDLLRNVSGADNLYSFLSAMNYRAKAGTSAFVFNENEDEIRLHSTACIHVQNRSWLEKIFLLTAGIQISYAEIMADTLAAYLEGSEVNRTTHPGSGIRNEPDSMLEALPGIVAPQSSSTSIHSAKDFRDAADRLSGLFPVTSGNGAFTAELPLEGPGPGIVYPGVLYDIKSGREMISSKGSKSARFTASTRKRHLNFGRGLFMSLEIPVSLMIPLEGFIAAARLNATEVRESPACHLMGGWLYDYRMRKMTFSACVPAMMYKPGMLVNFVLSSAARSVWVGRKLDSVIYL